MNMITSLAALKAAEGTCRLISFSIEGIGLLLAIIICQFLIAYSMTPPDRSYIWRRVAFIVLGLLFAVGFTIYEEIDVIDGINNVAWQSMYRTTVYQSAFVSWAAYMIVGIIFMFVFKTSKWGSILFGSKFKNK